MTMPEVDRLRLELAGAQFEVTQVKIQALQVIAAQQRQALEAMIATLKCEGYLLRRQDDGQWIYTPMAQTGAA